MLLSADFPFMHAVSARCIAFDSQCRDLDYSNLSSGKVLLRLSHGGLSALPAFVIPPTGHWLPTYLRTSVWVNSTRGEAWSG
jgi:hypothetical protein